MRNKNAGKMMLLTIAMAASVVLTACGADNTSADKATTESESDRHFQDNGYSRYKW